MDTSTYRPPGYDSDLSDVEWELLLPLFYPPGAKRGRGGWRAPNATRAYLDAMRYVLKTGCQWALLPKKFPPKSTVHDAFTAWTKQGLWERINDALRPKARVALKKNAEPTAAVIDSQSVKGGQLSALSSGYDAGNEDQRP